MNKQRCYLLCDWDKYEECTNVTMLIIENQQMFKIRGKDNILWDQNVIACGILYGHNRKKNN